MLLRRSLLQRRRGGLVGLPSFSFSSPSSSFSSPASSLRTTERAAWTPAPVFTLRCDYSSTSRVQLAKKDNKGGKKGGKDGDDEDGVQVVLPSIKDLEQTMDRRFSRLAIEFAEMRGGRVTPDMFNHVSIEAHGTRVQLHEVGQATLKTSSKINISVFDPELVQAVVKGIRDSGHGLSPSSEGNNIIINVPKPSKEAREALVKAAGRVAERIKTEVRSVRKDGMDAVKRLKSKVSEDDSKRLGKEVDALTERKIDAISKALKEKEKELLGD